MEFRVLGPVEVHEGSESLPLGGAKQRAILAFLLLHANQPVSGERLADALWGEEPPATASNVIQSYVSRLRGIFGSVEDAGRLTSRSSSYTLRVEPDELDSLVFARLVDEARVSLADGSTEAAAGKLRQALDLWRGKPYADFAYEDFAVGEVERLEELRLEALEDRIGADLALDRHSALVPELTSLIREHPTRERLMEHLMLALYRAGRQADALETFQEARRTLGEELGSIQGRDCRSSRSASWNRFRRWNRPLPRCRPAPLLPRAPRARSRGPRRRHRGALSRSRPSGRNPSVS